MGIEGREFQLPPARKVLEIGPGVSLNPFHWVDDLGEMSGTHLVLIDVRNLPQMPDFDPDGYLDNLNGWEFIPGEASDVISQGHPSLPGDSFDRIVMNNVLTAYGDIDIKRLMQNAVRLLNQTGEFVITEVGMTIPRERQSWQKLVSEALGSQAPQYDLEDDSDRSTWKIVIRPK